MTTRSNRNNRLHLLTAATALALTGLTAPAFAGQVYVGNLKDTGNQQFIIKFKSGSEPATSPASMAAALSSAASRAAMPAAFKGKRPSLRPLRQMIMPGGRVVASDVPLDRAQATELMKQIAADRNVEWVQRDGISKALLTPNDPSFAQQWHYADSAVGIRAPTAWNTSNGAGVVVAVIDSGIVSHTDLNANILPGYDFISSTVGFPDSECSAAGASPGCGRSDDGDGRDANPVDSSNVLHGTHVSGTIGAVTNNSVGVAGVAFGAKIVPIRVLGRQGFGSDSDIADAVVWASGGSVAGVPANANPAEVINLSLGGDEPCSQTPSWQAAVNTAVANGSTVIAAAGNSNIDVTGSTPAGCDNVISVAASNKSGSRSSYSSWGATIDITAPGGEQFIDGDSNGILSTYSGNGYRYLQGTSMAAPHASGVAALILSASSTPKTPAQVEQILESTARPIAANRCSGGCGAGIIDAAAAVAAASGGGTPGNQAPVANFSSSISGLTVNFTDSSSDSDGSIASRSWNFGDGTTSTATNPSKTYAAGGTYTVTLTVTDNGGATHSKTSTVVVSGGSNGVQTYSNTSSVNIPDNNATGVTSTINVSGRTGNAPNNAAVSVNIVHTYQGDLIVDLLAPDGSVYNLHNRTGAGTDNIVKTYTVNLSSEALNGAWKLRVSDRAGQDTGRIASWSIKF